MAAHVGVHSGMEGVVPLVYRVSGSALLVFLDGAARFGVVAEAVGGVASRVLLQTEGAHCPLAQVVEPCPVVPGGLVSGHGLIDRVVVQGFAQGLLSVGTFGCCGLGGLLVSALADEPICPVVFPCSDALDFGLLTFGKFITGGFGVGDLLSLGLGGLDLAGLRGEGVTDALALSDGLVQLFGGGGHGSVPFVGGGVECGGEAIHAGTCRVFGWVGVVLVRLLVCGGQPVSSGLVGCHGHSFSGSVVGRASSWVPSAAVRSRTRASRERMRALNLSFRDS
ncbi:hypothetical protein ACFFX0_24065 [Citricoccus parietis]|uniref:Uncharacterized protein n=1 Tax=Citricoccus parietis TaxID=592307 RepID=A0ABV5G654_9MICC